MKWKIIVISLAAIALTAVSCVTTQNADSGVTDPLVVKRFYCTTVKKKKFNFTPGKPEKSDTLETINTIRVENAQRELICGSAGQIK